MMQEEQHKFLFKQKYQSMRLYLVINYELTWLDFNTFVQGALKGYFIFPEND